MKFTSEESAILDLLQKGLPPVEEPYRFIAEKLSLDEEKIISLISSLREKRIIRNISGIFEGKMLGYTLSLVAFQVNDENIERAAEIINSHPGVSHNYLRKNKYNIWFTLAEESEESFTRSVESLYRKSGALDYLVLKNERLYKLGVILKTGDNDSEEAEYKSGSQIINKVEVNDKLKISISLLQKDLPAEQSPFKKIIEESGYTASVIELMNDFKFLLSNGIMRRYAAVLRHKEAGFRSNAMTAWKSDSNFDPEFFLRNKSITHLYLRTIYPGRWEYPLFAMIHARSGEELTEIINNLSEKSGITDYLVLDSLQEFKKTRVRYFSEEFNEWKRLNYD